MRIETGTRMPNSVLTRRRSMVRVATTLAIFGFVGCGSSHKEPQPPAPTVLRVAAASDLQGALPALAERFTTATGITITPVVGASGQLAEQIRQGAPFDVFLSANIAYVRKLASEGHITADSVRVYAQGRLVLVVSQESSVTVKGLADLARPEVKHISIANPDVAPYGLAARQALQKSGLWDGLKPKIVQAESVAPGDAVCPVWKRGGWSGCPLGRRGSQGPEDRR